MGGDVVHCVRATAEGSFGTHAHALELKDLGNLASTCEGVGYGAHHE